MGNQQYQSSFKLSPYRGTLYDHRKIPLAITVQTASIAVNPKIFSPNAAQLKALSELLSIPKAKIQALSLRSNYFSWLKRKIPFEVNSKVQALQINGLHHMIEPARYYPQGASAAPLIGAVGLDNKGLFGIEKRYDKDLSGESSEILRFKDARGKLILLNSSAAAPQKGGHNIVLTIDSVIQDIAEETLSKWVQKSEAKSGFVIIADPHTGKISGLANYPSFDPNDVKNLNIEHTNNLAISNLFEPGSVTKPFVISAALENKLIGESEIFNCEKNGIYQVDEKSSIRDDHKKEFANTAEVLIYSSNICTYKIAQRLGKQGLFNTLKTFGFASGSPLLNLTGEQNGRIDSWNTWKPIRFANIAFGQGMLVTGIEMVQAYSVFANGGNLVTPYLIERIENSDGETLFRANPETKRKVLSTQTAQIMRNILKRVVIEGTGSLAATKLFSTAGKTGTSEKVDPETRKYSSTKRIASFAGFAPVQDPHLVIYIVIDEPQKKPYYGGVWAAPAFSEIAELCLKYLNVAPDQGREMIDLRHKDQPSAQRSPDEKRQRNL
ncbi:MAG: penicillin-binding protein 2 [Oligoflexales bacterium]|nr:penicillin-binding protein 2 [Oligoflexales bacterium]